jgi:hypothetical protein
MHFILHSVSRLRLQQSTSGLDKGGNRADEKGFRAEHRLGIYALTNCVMAEGQGSVSSCGASGSGSVATGTGKGVTDSGNVQKSENGVSANGTATTNSGKTASGSLDGNKESGTVTATTEQGTKTAEYGDKEKPTAKSRPRLGMRSQAN